MALISYAQNQEDVRLLRVLGEQPCGCYVDVGAAHPRFDSVTQLFYQRGWHGVNVEPVASYAELLRAERPRDITLEMGAADVEGELPFFEDRAFPSLSTFRRDIAEAHRAGGHEIIERRARVITLARIWTEYGLSAVDFLKIDAEGAEAQVLASADWERCRPRVVLVEATRPLTSLDSSAVWEPVLIGAGYRFAAFDGLNRFYVRAEDATWASELARPVSVLDDYVPFAHFEELGGLRRRLMALEQWVAAKEAEVEKTVASLEETLVRKDQELAALAAHVAAHESTAAAFVASLKEEIAARERRIAELERAVRRRPRTPRQRRPAKRPSG